METSPNDWKSRVQGDLSLKDKVTEKYKTDSSCKRRNQNKSRFILDSAETGLRYPQREASRVVSIATIQ